MASVRPAPLMPLTTTSSGICSKEGFSPFPTGLFCVVSPMALSFRLGSHGPCARRGRSRARGVGGLAARIAAIASHDALVLALPIILLQHAVELLGHLFG